MNQFPFYLLILHINTYIVIKNSKSDRKVLGGQSSFPKEIHQKHLVVRIHFLSYFRLETTISESIPTVYSIFEAFPTGKLDFRAFLDLKIIFYQNYKRNTRKTTWTFSIFENKFFPPFFLSRNGPVLKVAARYIDSAVSSINVSHLFGHIVHPQPVAARHKSNI